MKRANVGDLYAAHVPNGIKLYQWAYRIPKLGDFIRVFDGLYPELPPNPEEVVQGPHSYIIGYNAGRAYRLGLAERIGNYPVPEEYPYPDHDISFHSCPDGIVRSIEITRPEDRFFESFKVGRMCDLPPEFRSSKLMCRRVSPAWMLYLFDIDFSLEDLNRFFPGKTGED